MTEEPLGESLPLRECGLKFACYCIVRYSQQSLPLRECGLKLLKNVSQPAIPWSLPLRECGLKYKAPGGYMKARLVTPLAGVWVEIGSAFGAAGAL